MLMKMAGIPNVDGCLEDFHGVTIYQDRSRTPGNLILSWPKLVTAVFVYVLLFMFLFKRKNKSVLQSISNFINDIQRNESHGETNWPQKEHSNVHHLQCRFLVAT